MFQSEPGSWPVYGERACVLTSRISVAMETYSDNEAEGSSGELREAGGAEQQSAEGSSNNIGSTAAHELLKALHSAARSIGSADGGSRPSEAQLRPSALAAANTPPPPDDVQGNGGRVCVVQRRDREQQQIPTVSSPGCAEPIASQSAFTNSGSGSADSGHNSGVAVTGRRSIDSTPNFDLLQPDIAGSTISGPSASSGGGSGGNGADARATDALFTGGANNSGQPANAAQHGTNAPGMTAIGTAATSFHHAHALLRKLNLTTTGIRTEFRCAEKDTDVSRATTMMLSPTGSEVGLISMDPDSRASSRTSTPTAVRTRPRLPTGLTRNRDILAVAAAASTAINSSSTSPPRTADSLASAEDIACDFDSLGKTDFVRKYSTRVRSSADTLPRPGQGTASSSGQGAAATSLPETAQNALLMMSGGDIERDRSVRPHTLGGLPPTRTRSIKLKLEKLREARRSSECANLSRKESGDSSSPESSRKDSNSSCDSNQKKAPVESTGPVDTYYKRTENSIPRGQLHRLNITHSQTPLGKERRYYTLPGRRSASPAGHLPCPSDADGRESPSKTVAADRRLLHQNAVEGYTLDNQSEHGKHSVDISQDSVGEAVPSGKECATKTTRPAVVRWEIGRDSLDSDRSTPPRDRTKSKQGDEHRRKTSDVAEDEGVGEIDVDPNECYRVSSLSRSATKGHWINMKSSEITHTLDGDQGSAAATRGVSFKDTDRGDNVVCGPGKLPNGRFYTHPPSKERTSAQEAGSMDTNGFGALRDNRAAESQPMEGRKLQLSTVSIDSQSCIGEQNYSTYHDVLQDITADGTSIDSNLERKNSKTLKQKSKSDPCGEKQKESLRMTPSLDVHVQSTPLLIEEKQKSAQECSGSLNISAEKPTSISDSTLFHKAKNDQEAEGLSAYNKKEHSTDQPESSFANVRRSSSRKRDKRSAKDMKEKTISKEGSGDSTTNESENLTEMSPILVESDGELLSPDTQSPESTLERNKPVPEASTGSVMASLTLPFSKAKNTALTRSHSSASVFLSRTDPYRNTTPSPGSTRQKDLVKRRPHLSDHHLGPPSASGSVDLSGHKRDKNWASGYFPSLEPIYAQSSLSLFEGAAEEKDKRDLIVQEFCSTEEQYVEALQMLVERYMIPMKTKNVLDGNLVDDIFYKVNEIYMHHATFLTFLGKALQNWDSQTSTIGDIIHRNFSKQTVIESYVSFIENFPRAEKVLDEISTKSSFQKFIEGCEREMKMRLPLKAHIVKPAQRIPRYELLIKRLLDHTPPDHPDYKCLLEAENSIHQLALRINSVKESRQEEDYQETLKKLELLLITDLVVADRTYIRHDMVQILSRKDQCCVWLFSDLAVFSSVKRKSGPVNRKTTLLLQSPAGNDFVENSKHKMWLKISLEDLEIVQLESSPTKKQLVDKEVLESDKKLLEEISELTSQLNCDHSHVDEAVNELVLQVNKQLSEHQRKSPPPEANKVELMANTTEGLEHLVMVFPSPDKRASWEAAFTAAKQKLAALAEGKPPEFSQALPITKTRAGMQFSCAAPIDGFNDKHFHDVWVCNSDGYVGHMCLLSLQPEPIVTLNTPVPGCNSRILCICAVPALQNAHKRKNSRRKLGVTTPTILVHEADDVRANHRRRVSRKSKSGYSQSSSSDTDTSNTTDSDGTDEPQSRKTSTGSTIKEKLSSQSMQSAEKESKLLDPSKSTMWLGTEDGCILVFTSTDNLKTTKNKVKLQQNAGILCICYLEFKVFASLANGDVVIYNNKEDGTWDLSNPVTITVSSAGVPINKLLAVAGRLWCACQHEIYIVNPLTLEVEVSFTGNPDAKKPIQCMATSGHGVWIACQQSAKVSLFHAMSHQLLTQVSVAQAVAQKLQNADDIIRQHKTACLRITSLLTCKDLLWIGTSAGVILNIPLPKISQATDKNSITLGSLTGLAHGHTGHVRFLTAVDMSPQSRRSLHQDESSATADGTPTSWRSRRMSLGLHTFNMSTKMLVISGGDGFEDFRNVTPNESTGRDDSTNHLLLWQV